MLFAAGNNRRLNGLAFKREGDKPNNGVKRKSDQRDTRQLRTIPQHQRQCQDRHDAIDKRRDGAGGQH